MQYFKRVRTTLRALMPAGAFTIIIVGLGCGLGLVTVSGVAVAKTPGSTYCFYGKCHRVKTLSETQALVGKEVSLHTSHYDSCRRDRYNPCGLTSSGEPFFADRADNAASPIYPDGTKLLVWSQQSNEAAVIRVNNAGPYWGNRKLDVSRALARKLGFEHRGVAKLQVRVLSAPTRAEARYKRNRRYAKVQGPIGKFANLDEAEKGLAVLLAFEAMTTAFMAPAGGSMVGQVKRPFEVAALATQGRAFGEVRPELTTWPVVGLRFATLEWPVVGAVGMRSSKASVQIASVDGEGGARAALRSETLKAWPVVGAPAQKRSETPLVRVAVAWPIVQEPVVVQEKTTRRALRVAHPRVRVKEGRKAAAPHRRTQIARDRKARTLRLAALRSKSKVKARTRKSKKRKSRTSKSRKRKVAKAQRSNARVEANVKAKAKSKTKLLARVRTKRAPKPVVKLRPHVATRQILHRTLGRGA